MAIAAGAVYEVRTTGSDTNGGGFVTGSSGTDWSQQNSAQYAVTNAVTNGTTTITSSTANFGTDVVGNILYIQGGTGSITAGWYQITSRTNSTTIVVDRSTGLTTGTGATLNIGGALASPGQAAQIATTNGNKIWINQGTYNVSTSTAGSGGPVSTGTNSQIVIEGYDVTRGDRTANRPILKWTASSPGATSYLVVLATNPSVIVSNIEMDGNNVTNVSGASFSNRGLFIDCIAKNCSTTSQAGFYGGGASSNRGPIRCYATNCTKGFSYGSPVQCIAYNCGTGFSDIYRATYCIAYANTGDGFNNSSGVLGAQLINCTSTGNTGDGFDTSASNSAGFLNCVSTNNTGYGFNLHATNFMRNCATFNNTSGATNGTPHLNSGAVLLSADPYQNSASDWRPNFTSSGKQLTNISDNLSISTYAQTIYYELGAVQLGKTYINKSPTNGGFDR